MGSSPPVLTKPDHAWICHSAGVEKYGSHAGQPTEGAVYDLLPNVAKAGFTAVGLFDYCGYDGLQRPGITKIVQRCAVLGMTVIPGVVFSCKDSSDRSGPANWEKILNEVLWWRPRGAKRFLLDCEDVWGMNSQDVTSDDPALNGKPLQTVEQVMQSVTAIRHGLAAILREGVTPCIYGPQRSTSLNPMSRRLTDALAAQFPPGALWVQYRTDIDPPSLWRLYGHFEPDGLAQAIATGGALYAPCWSLEAQLAAVKSVAETI